MFRFSLFFSILGAAAAANSIPRITSATAGPYRVSGKRILDAHGQDYLIRGTRLPPITLDDSATSPAEFGKFSGTTLVTIRQRMNMNAIRFPVDAQAYQADQRYRARVDEVVRRANRFELLAILEAQPGGEPNSRFWALCAADFRGNPNVFFALPPAESAQTLVDAIRSAGAEQPVIVRMHSHVMDSNIIYEVVPSYSAKIDFSSMNAPLLVDGLDPQLDRTGRECAAFPSDPGAASRRIEELLNSFDEHQISWTISSLEPGKLIDGYRGYNWTKLDAGWTCGTPTTYVGIAMELISHLWSVDSHGLFTVNQPAGGFVIARGANSSAYGPILAERDVTAGPPPLPVKLGQASVRVTDSKGVVRLAPLLWVGAGWSNVNLIVPENSALGPAEIALVRADGSTTSSRVIIADAAPGLWTASHDGRGAVIAQVFQRFPNGKTVRFPAWTCLKGDCSTPPIPLSPHVSTTARIEGTGFRFAGSKAELQVTIDRVAVPVISYGPMPTPGRDSVTVRIPDELIGRGEVDVVIIARGAISNVARINCGQK